MIRAGDELPNGFKVAVANPETWINQPFGNQSSFRPGNYEVQREVSPGVFVKFQGSSEQKVLDKAARWLADQARLDRIVDRATSERSDPFLVALNAESDALETLDAEIQKTHEQAAENRKALDKSGYSKNFQAGH